MKRLHRHRSMTRPRPQLPKIDVAVGNQEKVLKVLEQEGTNTLSFSWSSVYSSLATVTHDDWKILVITQKKMLEGEAMGGGSRGEESARLG